MTAIRHESSPAWLVEHASGTQTPAELWDAITDRNVDDWENGWRPARDRKIAHLEQSGADRSALPEHRHWDWKQKAAAFSGSLANPSFAVVCQEMTQGLMIVDNLKSARLSSHQGKPLVYIDFLEAAPWNCRYSRDDEPRFRGVGSLLLRAAIELSRLEGFKGRIGLHSLPQSMNFYARCGLTDLGADASKQNLHYLEMTTDQADGFTV